MSLTELDVAERIRDGTQDSPVEFYGMHLVNLRITGTGMAYRVGLDETVWRDPDIYLNDTFLRRCNGLPVILLHTDEKTLGEAEFQERAVGAVMLPYIKGDEVWAVCRVYSQDVVDAIREGKLSTSPNVVFSKASGNAVFETEEGALLIEGVPFLVDHIALVPLGVWDKNHIPEGIQNNTGEAVMGDENKDEKLDAIMEALKGVGTGITTLTERQDAMEQEWAAEKQRRADEATQVEEARKQEEESRRQDEQRKEEEERQRADAAERDAEAIADAQARADAVYADFGKQARAPMSGESLLNYRKRLLKGLQMHSPTYKDVDIIAIADAALLNIAEKQVYADAAVVARNPVPEKPGELVVVVRKDEAGRPVKTYHGNMNSWLGAFKTSGMQVAKFNTSGSAR
ncbi:DUF2213 domain-containing protein [Serratia fonticola]|uniref:DUF2213 domain-containing protein n=1 Tax=Serratia fonticola TaxID=47917 RepID=UPI00301CE1EC